MFPLINTIPIICCSIVAIIFFFVGKSFSKVIKPTSEEVIKYSIDNVKFFNTLNPLVKDIYLQFISKDGVKYFQEVNCHILISNTEVQFWSVNEVYNRIFTYIPEEILKQYGLTIKEINNTLTLADRKILDNIAKAVKVNNQEFISRLFI